MPELDRPAWPEWFMTICFVVSQKSLDPATKHGCVVVDEENTILSIGYNSPPRGCDDSTVPLTRPEKYGWMEHAESNAINNAARTGISLRGSTFYITGHPCLPCLRRVINVGAVEIVYGPVGSQCISEEDRNEMYKMLRSPKVNVILSEFDETSMGDLKNLLDNTQKYILRKVG